MDVCVWTCRQTNGNLCLTSSFTTAVTYHTYHPQSWKLKRCRKVKSLVVDNYGFSGFCDKLWSPLRELNNIHAHLNNFYTLHRALILAQLRTFSISLKYLYIYTRVNTELRFRYSSPGTRCNDKDQTMCILFIRPIYCLCLTGWSNIQTHGLL